MKSTTRSSAPIMPEVMPVMYQAFQAGIIVMRYLSDPMRMKREAEPKNEIIKDIKMLIIMLVIRSFFRRFLRAISDSCTYCFKMAFISSNNTLMISLKEVIYVLPLFPKSNPVIKLSRHEFLEGITDKILEKTGCEKV